MAVFLRARVTSYVSRLCSGRVEDGMSLESDKQKSKQVPQSKQEVVATSSIEDVLKGLTPGQRKFSEFYAVYDNKQKSALLAGYGEDYGHYALGLPSVQRAVEYFREIHREKTLYSQEKLLRQWSAMASIDLTDYVTDDYELKPLNELTADQREHLGLALVGLEVTEKRGRKQVKPKYAKVEALESLSKIMKLYGEKNQQTGEGLTLHINLGQHVNVEQHPEETVRDLGPFSVRLPGMSEEEDAGL